MKLSNQNEIQWADTCLDHHNWLSRACINYKAALFTKKLYNIGRKISQTGEDNLYIYAGHHYLMQFGFALECLLKAIIVTKFTNLRDVDGRLNKVEFKKKIVSHKLDNLFKLAIRDPSSEELIILHGLSECVIWMGRYPMPVSIDDAIKVGEFMAALKGQWPFDVNNLDNKDDKITELCHESTLNLPNGKDIWERLFLIDFSVVPPA